MYSSISNKWVIFVDVLCIQVAQYINLPEAVLNGFLDKCTRDEERDVEWIREK